MQTTINAPTVLPFTAVLYIRSVGFSGNVHATESMSASFPREEDATAWGAKRVAYLTASEATRWSASPAGQAGEPCPYSGCFEVSVRCPDCGGKGLKKGKRTHKPGNGCETCHFACRVPISGPRRRSLYPVGPL